MGGNRLAGLAVVLVCRVLVLGVLVVVAAFGAAVGVNVVAVYISFHATWLLLKCFARGLCLYFHPSLTKYSKTDKNLKICLKTAKIYDKII